MNWEWWWLDGAEMCLVKARATDRMFVSDLSSSEQEISKCSKLVMTWAIWDTFAMACTRFAIDSLMEVVKIASSDWKLLSERKSWRLRREN